MSNISIDIERARRAERRDLILKVLDRARPKGMDAGLLLRNLQQTQATFSLRQLNQELQYLQEKEVVAQDEKTWRITTLGIDLREGTNPNPPPGVPGRDFSISSESVAYRAEIRGRLLTALYYSRPCGATSALLWRVLDDSDLAVPDGELAKEADYLAGLGLATLNPAPECGPDGWAAQLTAAGQDVIERVVKAPKGIALAEKYWED